MSRKGKLLLITFLILLGTLTMVSLYAFMPTAKASMDYYLGPTAQNVATGISNMWVGITSSPTWQMYVAPNLLWIGIVSGVLLTVFVLNPLKDAWTGFWSQRHKVSVIPATTIAAPLRSTTPAGATTRPTTQQVAVEPAPQKSVVTEEEEVGETA